MELTEDGHNLAGHGSPETDAAADGKIDDNHVIATRAEQRIYDPV